MLNTVSTDMISTLPLATSVMNSFTEREFLLAMIATEFIP
jgi:hypothetical protein